MHNTKIKICGLSKLEDALASATAGADFLGIIFEPNSRRCLDIEAAKKLVESFSTKWRQEKPKWVGVFANQPLDEINNLLTYCNMDIAQLSGHESPEYCLQVVRPVIKVIHVRTDTPLRETLWEVKRSITEYYGNGHACMLDTFKEGVLGGTGQTFDWEVASALSNAYYFLLAGGLSPENVAEAIEEVKPWGIDVSSGVETNGQKDPAKIAQFIDQVRHADQTKNRLNLTNADN